MKATYCMEGKNMGLLEKLRDIRKHYAELRDKDVAKEINSYYSEKYGPEFIKEVKKYVTEIQTRGYPEYISTLQVNDYTIKFKIDQYNNFSFCESPSFFPSQYLRVFRDLLNTFYDNKVERYQHREIGRAHV